MSGEVEKQDADLWTAWRRLTAARIGLERSGASLATAPQLRTVIFTGYRVGVPDPPGVADSR